MRWHLFTVVAAGLLLAADSPKDAAKEEQGKMQGTWKMVALTSNGMEAPAEKIQDLRLTVRDNEYTVKNGNDTVAVLTFTLDPTKKIKEIDLTYKEGERRGKTNKAIYKLDGDTLTLCRHNSPDQDRPTEFASKPDSQHILTVWKRDK